MPAPPLTRPLPTVTADPPPAPRCGCCSDGTFWDDDFGDVSCPMCHGTEEGAWVAPCELVLGTMHAHPKPGQRRAVYDPNRQRLTVTLRSKAERYAVFETGAAKEFGRGFTLVKLDANGLPVVENGDVVRREFQCGAVGVSCSCQGGDFLSNAKANQRALESGDTVHPSYGCKHSDAMVPLLMAGWFDLSKA